MRTTLLLLVGSVPCSTVDGIDASRVVDMLIGRY